MPAAPATSATTASAPPTAWFRVRRSPRRRTVSESDSGMRSTSERRVSSVLVMGSLCSGMGAHLRERAVGQERGEGGPAARQARLDRALGCSHLVGDLGDRQAAEVVQDDGSPLGLRDLAGGRRRERRCRRWARACGPAARAAASRPRRSWPCASGWRPAARRPCGPRPRGRRTSRRSTSAARPGRRPPGSAPGRRTGCRSSRTSGAGPACSRPRRRRRSPRRPSPRSSLCRCSGPAPVVLSKKDDARAAHRVASAARDPPTGRRVRGRTPASGDDGSR